MPDNPPAGWYPAPHANDEQRYWDGNQWTEPETEPTTAYPAAQPVDSEPVADDGKPKKSKKVWIIAGSVVGGLIVIGAIGSALGMGGEVEPVAAPTTSIEEPSSEPTAAAPVEEPVVTEEPEPDVPVEYTSALTKAGIYANSMHMSKAGLYDQLTSEYGEKFSPEAAQYAVDNVQADWNANALAKAKLYQDDMAMSPEAIRDQLVSEYGEQFTQEEADYAIANLNG